MMKKKRSCLADDVHDHATLLRFEAGLEFYMGSNSQMSNDVVFGGNLGFL